MRLPERSYPVNPYRFLVDQSVAKAGAMIPASPDRVLYLRDIGLSENASDSSIVQTAAEEHAIIVTANGWDFLCEVEKFQKKQMEDDCHDLFGLLILPNCYADQARLLPKISEKLRFGGSAISWRHVQINDLSVRLNSDGNVQTLPLARCRYCLHHDPKRPTKNN